MVAAALCTLLALLATPVLGQDSQVLAAPSPCPTVFTYDLHEPEPGWWSGVVNLSTDVLLHSLWLDIVLDSQAIKLLHGMVEVFTEDFKNFMIENEDMQIQPGIPISLRFSVQYDTNEEVPRVQTIRLNGIVICNALSAEEQTDSRLKTNINSNMRPVLNQSKQSINPVYPRPGDRNISNAGDNLSGRNDQNSKYMYAYCGGTLLSQRHVITSGKCVHGGGLPLTSQTRPVIDKNRLQLHLGKHNISSVLGVQIRLVQDIIVYPDYVETEFSYSGHDVALLVLQEPVAYTDWVRPVCLWPANEIDHDSLIGKKGWFVGWGVDEKHDVTEQLSEVEMPVVSQETCYKSEGYLAYNFAISNKYYCAGNREDTGLCRGVSLGNGMVFKMGNSWYLRGHLSFFLYRKLNMNTTRTCDPTKYLQFTDLAKHVQWIHSIFSKFD